MVKRKLLPSICSTNRSNSKSERTLGFKLVRFGQQKTRRAGLGIGALCAIAAALAHGRMGILSLVRTGGIVLARLGTLIKSDSVPGYPVWGASA